MKVALIEGLGSYFFGRYLYKAIAKELKAKGYEVNHYPWTAGKLPFHDVVIGHSFGGGYAMKNAHPCRALVTLDARRWDFWNNDKLERPHGIGVQYNFFQQRDFLKGYPVWMAKNKKRYASHVGLPEAVKKELLEIVEKYSVSA